MQFLFSIGVILLGVFCIGFHYAPHLRQALAGFILSSSLLFSIGCVLSALGVCLLAGFYYMYRGVYYSFSMENRVTSVDSKIIQEYVRQYWEEQLPGEEAEVAVLLRPDQKIEVYLEWKGFSLEAQKALLEGAENELSALLKQQFGYSKEFFFSVLLRA